jgi:thioredoxin reductase/NAD-dependent dihydropyrimidine dehydrogenase PreA subunit
MDTTLLAWYLVPAAALVLFYVARRKRTEAADARELADAVASGMTEPPSLHPIVDPLRCIASGTCVRACPENALGIVDGRATLVSPAACIGHGACEASCPVQAIRLVLGTERRGIDIPRVDANFETNVPGVFVAGELGGMGLIRKASEQGRQAMRTIASRPRARQGLDVLIVGAGPAGIAAGLAAIEAKLAYRVIEQEPDLGGSVFHYPRHKIAMTQPVDLPIVGTMRFTEVSKEALLAFWRRIVSGTGLVVHYSERFDALERVDGGFRVTTTRGTYATAHVLLAIGRRGTPRKLGVDGEERAKVVYRLVDPAQYRGQRVLVVGGGVSAVEAALSSAGEPGTTVTLAYRGEAFSRVKPANRERLEKASRDGRLDVRLQTEIASIAEREVTLAGAGGESRLANDGVIVQAGGVLPTELLRSMGVDVETRHGAV